MIGEFNDQRCIRCGQCLSRCPYVKLDPDRARREIELMAAGEYSFITDRCMGCATCEAFCPRDAHPYALIRRQWRNRYRRRGLPERARVMMPHQHPNFRTLVRLPRPERRLLAEWKQPKSGDVVVFAGCNALVIPYSLQTPILGPAPILGDYELCCGEMYWRMGLFDDARRVAEGVAQRFREMRIKKLVMVCMAGLNMFSNVYPNDFGIKLDMEFEFVSDYLLERLDAGEFRIIKPLNRTLAVQDSCHAKMLDPRLFESPRELLTRAGARIKELEHSRREAMCCGVAGACARYNPLDILSSGLARFREARSAGVKGIVAYCNGCLLTLTACGLLHPGIMPVYSMIELVSEAAGFKMPHRHPSRILNMLTATAFKTAPALLDPRRIKKVVD